MKLELGVHVSSDFTDHLSDNKCVRTEPERKDTLDSYRNRLYTV